MYISRNSYLEKLKQSIGNGMIKIITGPRRAGKSFLLFHIFKDYLPVTPNTEIRSDSIPISKTESKTRKNTISLSMKFNFAEASITLLLMVLEPLMERYRK